jgi:hypothetical protein
MGHWSEQFREAVQGVGSGFGGKQDRGYGSPPFTPNSFGAGVMLLWTQHLQKVLTRTAYREVLGVTAKAGWVGVKWVSAATVVAAGSGFIDVGLEKASACVG